MDPTTPSAKDEPEMIVEEQAVKEDSVGGCGGETAPETDDEDDEKKQEVVRDNIIDDGNDKKADNSQEGDKSEKKYVDWPLKNIEEPHENDVLYGRGGEYEVRLRSEKNPWTRGENEVEVGNEGRQRDVRSHSQPSFYPFSVTYHLITGGTNHHPGNKRYRKMVEDRKVEYVNSKRLDKPLVALGIIREWRAQDPPGRFLKIDEKTGLWNDVGDKKAREKTSQALREKAPQIRKQQEEELHGKEGDDEAYDSENSKNTRFAEGTKSGDVQKAILERDHSLGREYLDEGEAVTLDGFSWQDPFLSSKERKPSSGNSRVSSGSGGGDSGSRQQSGQYRFPSQGSLGPPPPPPPPGAYAHMTGGVISGGPPPPYHPNARFDSWGSASSFPPPPMPGYGAYPPHHQHSASWGPSGPPVPPREHSLGHNPLPHASVGHPASYGAFDHHRSGSWGPPPPGAYHPGSYGPPPPHYYAHPPPPPPPATSPRAAPGYPNAASSPPTATNGPSSPRYSVDPVVASAWSGKDPTEIAQSWSGGSSSNGGNAGEEYDQFTGPRPSPRSPSGRNDITQPALSPNGSRPDIIKRHTSNQNETIETKPDLRGPSVKRAALNRDSSAAANRLKEKYVPGWKPSGTAFNAEHEVNQLSENLEQSTLNNGAEGVSAVRPLPLREEERMSTIDQIAMDLMVKPVSLSNTNRSSTIEALALDLNEDDPFIRPGPVERGSTMDEVFNDLKDGAPKPATLSAADRLTTKDFYDLVTEPIGEDPELFTSPNMRYVGVMPR